MSVLDEMKREEKMVSHIAVGVALSAGIGVAFGFYLGLSFWEDSNVTPVTKPDCELRKGYYTVINVSESGIIECGLTKKFYGPSEEYRND